MCTGTAATTGRLYRPRSRDRIICDLTYFNAVNDVQLRAELQAGEAFGTTDYVLTALAWALAMP